MVARTPPKLKKVPPLNPVLSRETVKKVDKCMQRLQELQCIVASRRKVVPGASVSPRSTRGCLRTSLRCKQESLRTRSGTALKSPVQKFPASAGGEWRRMSLPAMLVDETVGEILQATQFARQILNAVSNKENIEQQLLPDDDPKTPMTQSSNQNAQPENTKLRTHRKWEKQQNKPRESHSPSLRRARSGINFKVSPPKQRQSSETENVRYMANRVSPRHKPWARKTVLFPNPLFLSTDSKQNQQHKFFKTGSPVIANKKPRAVSPHKFLIKSPQSASKFQVKIKSPTRVSFSPPTRQSTKAVLSFPDASRLRGLSSPTKLRQSFSPSRIAKRLMSPLKSRKSAQKNSCDRSMAMSGLKQRPVATPVPAFSSRRI